MEQWKMHLMDSKNSLCHLRTELLKVGLENNDIPTILEDIESRFENLEDMIKFRIEWKLKL